MPLINCPECGKELSAEAQACLQCGHPIATTFQAEFNKALVQQAVTRQHKKFGCGTLFIIGAVGYLVIVLLNSLLNTGPGQNQQSETSQAAAYQAGALAGELEARFASNSGQSFGYPFDRRNAEALAQQKVGNAGEFANGAGRQKWIDGFADAFKTYADGKATELHRIR